MYFDKLPYTAYQFPDGDVRYIKNLGVRPSLVEDFINENTRLKKYIIGDEDTPEVLAYDNYDDVNMHWIIMLTNNILNIYEDWPKNSTQLSKYLQDKYREQSDSDGNTVTLTETEINEYLDFTGVPDEQYTSYIEDKNVVLRPHHFEDSNGTVYSFDAIINGGIDAFGRLINVPDVTPVSHFEYESNLNEAKREIYLLDLDDALKVKKEVEKYLNGYK